MKTLEQLDVQMTEMQQKMREAQTFMETNGRLYIEAAVAHFLEACPEVTSVFWRQYTPYFNDGSPCEFSVHDLCFSLDSIDDVDGDGAWLYTEEDYQNALKHVEDVRQFEADPQAWRKAYRAAYYKKNMREYHVKDEYLYPYPRTVEAAQKEVAEIELQRTLVSSSRAEEIRDAFEALSAQFKRIPEATMRAVYGDHVRVTITRSGTETDDYNHY